MARIQMGGMNQRMSIMMLSVIFLFSGVVFAQDKSTQTGTSVKAKYDLAVDYFLKKDYPKACSAFSEVFDEEPEPYNGIVLFNLGMCFQTAGVSEDEKGNKDLSKALFQQASVHYDKAQKVLPYFPQLYSNSALVAYYLHSPKDDVRKVFDFAQNLTDGMRDFPPDIEDKVFSYRSDAALLSIAANYIRSDKFSEAVDILKEAISQMEKTPPKKDYFLYTAYNLLGEGFSGLDNIKDAIIAVETSLKVSPIQKNPDDIYANLGMLYYRQGNKVKAQEATDKALAINPQNKIALLFQGRLKTP